ncbi:MAG: hypothetical protein CL454_00700 [Acidimicrobiaceae bacterium]|nr:hypothetical protein [Acidimicrobiaceae bacterium]
MNTDLWNSQTYTPEKNPVQLMRAAENVWSFQTYAKPTTQLNSLTEFATTSELMAALGLSSGASSKQIQQEIARQRLQDMADAFVSEDEDRTNDAQDLCDALCERYDSPLHLGSWTEVAQTAAQHATQLNTLTEFATTTALMAALQRKRMTKFFRDWVRSARLVPEMCRRACMGTVKTADDSGTCSANEYIYETADDSQDHLLPATIDACHAADGWWRMSETPPKAVRNKYSCLGGDSETITHAEAAQRCIGAIGGTGQREQHCGQWDTCIDDHIGHPYSITAQNEPNRVEGLRDDNEAPEQQQYLDLNVGGDALVDNLVGANDFLTTDGMPMMDAVEVEDLGEYGDATGMGLGLDNADMDLGEAGAAEQAAADMDLGYGEAAGADYAAADMDLGYGEAGADYAAAEPAEAASDMGLGDAAAEQAAAVMSCENMCGDRGGRCLEVCRKCQENNSGDEVYSCMANAHGDNMTGAAGDSMMMMGGMGR